ncbi:MAG: hypothetical protein AAGA86_08520 [Bacteroidota bacterium]
MSVLLFMGCGGDDDGPTPPDNGGEDPEETGPVALREGYVVTGNLVGTTFAQYVEELPTRTVNVSQGTDFQFFSLVSVVDGALFTNATDGSNGIEKIIVNEERELEIVGTIATVGAPFALTVRDSEFGVFHDTNNPMELTTFNPTTMEVTGSIDMSIVNELGRDTGNVGFSGFFFRGDSEMIVSLDATPRLEGMPRVIVDLSTMQGSDIAVFETTPLNQPPIIVANNSIDEAGNYYGAHFTSEALPMIPGGILKIPAGETNYDQTYNFQVAVQNNPALSLIGGFLTAYEYFENNKAFVKINERLDDRILEIFAANDGNPANIDQNELNEVLLLLQTSPTAIFAEVDLVTQEITKIEGVPGLPVFTGGGLYTLDGQPHFSVVSGENNALYRYAGSGSATLVLEATGASLGRVINLAEDFQ